MSLSPPPASPAASCGQESPAGGPSCHSTPVKQSSSCRCIVLTILYYLLPPLNVFIGFSFQCDSPRRSAVIDNDELGEAERDEDGLDEAGRDDNELDEAGRDGAKLIGMGRSGPSEAGLSSAGNEDAVAVAGLSDTASASVQRVNVHIVDGENNNNSRSQKNMSPRQPKLQTYNKIFYKSENCYRDFQYKWFKEFQFLDYSTESKSASCFACTRYSTTNNSWSISDWKNTSNIKKHAKSMSHKDAMMKWMDSVVVQSREKSSVASQISTHHADQVEGFRKYARVLFQNIAFLGMQGLAFRGHMEPRENLSESCSVNRGNFLELLSLRAKDLPEVKLKIDSPVSDFGFGGKGFAKWTHSSTQNEMIEILSSHCLTKIVEEVKSEDKKHYFYSVIVDETSDMSKLEQFSVSVSYLDSKGAKQERYLKFIEVEKTDGAFLNEKLKAALLDLGLDPCRAVSIAADGASNMSGVYRGLAAQFREAAPLVLYTHCYAHVLNLVVKDLLQDINNLKHVMGVLQSLYNFLESKSTKRHNIYMNIDLGDQNSKVVKVVKNLSATRWSMRHDAVQAVNEEMPRVLKCLHVLSEDKDAATSSTADSLLKNIFSFNFVLGIMMLNAVLSHTSRLSDFLQGRKVDIRAARDNVQLTIQTLQSMRNEASFETIWRNTESKCAELQDILSSDETSDHEFVGPKVPRAAKWSGDEMSYFRATQFYAMLDKIVANLKDRFNNKESSVVYDMATIVEDESVDEEVVQRVASYYGMDADQMCSELQMYNQFKVHIKINLKSLFVSWFYLQKRIDVSRMVSSEIAAKMIESGASALIPNIFKVIQILATMPVSSCEAERSFSALRRIKNYMRTKTGQARLSSLTLFHLERDILNDVMRNDINKMINEFGSRNGRNHFFF